MDVARLLKSDTSMQALDCPRRHKLIKTKKTRARQSQPASRKPCTAIPRCDGPGPVPTFGATLGLPDSTKRLYSTEALGLANPKAQPQSLSISCGNPSGTWTFLGASELTKNAQASPPVKKFHTGKAGEGGGRTLSRRASSRFQPQLQSPEASKEPMRPLSPHDKNEELELPFFWVRSFQDFRLDPSLRRTPKQKRLFLRILRIPTGPTTVAAPRQPLFLKPGRVTGLLKERVPIYHEKHPKLRD